MDHSDERKRPREPSPGPSGLQPKRLKNSENVFEFLSSMFPTLPKDFLQRKSEELDGKPLELEHFIARQLDSNSSTFWNQVEETEEDLINSKVEKLIQLFPQVDPEYLHLKVTENGYEDESWISEAFENIKNLPSRADYEKRQKEAEILQKYSGQVSVQEILELFEDPETYFMDRTRKVSELYKKHSLSQLKKDFKNISVDNIRRVFNDNFGLYAPCYKLLQEFSGPTLKSKRSNFDAEAPKEIEINFLKELQFIRKEKEIKMFIKEKENEHLRKLEEARKNNWLMECLCCFNDECLVDDMFECNGKHLFCKECLQRASEVAMGQNKHQLTCLGQCQEPFPLSTLKEALNPKTFSKWLSKIQQAEIENANINNLEQCPFCNFATIIETSPEEDKIFNCLNPECKIESCRLCKEKSHLPESCNEVEKDEEVKKRTYIENKMTEALIRKCWKCNLAIVKSNGCNMMTCVCGANMCYVCRKPIKGHGHFMSSNCPGTSSNKVLHDQVVERAALQAKNDVNKDQPNVELKHDPTIGLNLNSAKKREERRKRKEKENYVGFFNFWPFI